MTAPACTYDDYITTVSAYTNVNKTTKRINFLHAQQSDTSIVASSAYGIIGSPMLSTVHHGYDIITYNPCYLENGDITQVRGVVTAVPFYNALQFSQNSNTYAFRTNIKNGDPGRASIYGNTYDVQAWGPVVVRYGRIIHFSANVGVVIYTSNTEPKLLSYNVFTYKDRHNNSLSTVFDDEFYAANCDCMKSVWCDLYDATELTQAQMQQILENPGLIGASFNTASELHNNYTMNVVKAANSSIITFTNLWNGLSRWGEHVFIGRAVFNFDLVI